MSKRQLQKSLRWERVTKERARERTYRAVYHRSRDRGRTARPSRLRPLALLAYRYFGYSSTAAFNDRAAHPRRPDPFHSFSLVPDEFVVLDKKPPMARTRNVKSARDVSIDSVTADLWHDSPRPIRKAPLHPLESVARRCGILHLRSLPLTRAGTDNVSPPCRCALAKTRRDRIERSKTSSETKGLNVFFSKQWFQNRRQNHDISKLFYRFG